MMRIKDIINKIIEISNNDPRINDRGVGQLSDIQECITTYPYFWIDNDFSHQLIDDCQVIEYEFQLRVGDRINDNLPRYNVKGQPVDNGLDASSNSFTILLDIINVIKSDSLSLFNKELKLVNDITFEPFYHEDNSDVNGFNARIILRSMNTNRCNNPITDIN